MVKHTEADETIKFYIMSIAGVFKQRPKLLDFCQNCESKGKLSPEKMTELIEFIRELGVNEINALMTGTYPDVFNRLKSLRNARCKDGINNQAIEDYI